MCRLVFLLLLSLCLAGWASSAQVEKLPASEKGPGKNQAPPRSDRDKEAGESSSRDTKIDLSPPRGDAEKHPNSGAAVSDAEAETSGDVQEFHRWDPHKAAKDIEVGDFYFKRKNYRAALARYQDALVWKNNDAMANFRMGQCFEKLDHPEEAASHYEEYLKILPHGPLSADAHKALEKLQAEGSQASGKGQPKE
jgi:tetratricopeptide (TPR) repeat protein